jgi:hypothetical protein
MWQSLARCCKEDNINLVSYIGGLLKSPDPSVATRNRIYDLFNENDGDGCTVWTGAMNWHISDGDMLDFLKGFQPLPMITLETSYTGIPNRGEAYPGSRASGGGFVQRSGMMVEWGGQEHGQHIRRAVRKD